MIEMVIVQVFIKLGKKKKENEMVTTWFLVDFYSFRILPAEEGWHPEDENAHNVIK